MRSSFYNQARAVDVIIKSSQAEWKLGYEMGRKQGASLSDQKLASRNYSASFRDGHRRGRNELLGIPEESIPLAERVVQTPEEIAKIQYERGEFLGRRNGRNCDELSEETLRACHPAFVKGYYHALALYEDSFVGNEFYR